MGVSVVRKSPSMVVRPSEPMPTSGGAIKLSSFDKPGAMLPVTSFLVFEHPIREAAETIKRALSRALVYYYPISGRIVAGPDDDELHIRCNGEGVAFVAASADHALKDVEFFARSPDTKRTLLDELATYYPAAERCGPADPLLLMQVTEFSCGGFVLGVTWNHGVADGAGIAQFLQAVGELACGMSSPSLAPVRRDDSLLSLPRMSPPVLCSEPLDLACLDITVPSSSIDRIRAKFHEPSNGQMTCTMFEAVAALLWQCRTRAIAAAPNSLASLYFAANVRKRVNAMDGYYGNCITTRLVTATTGTVVNADIMDLVKMIKCAKDGTHDHFPKNEEGCDQLGQLRYNVLILSSWRNLGFEKADFGGGTPKRVMTYRQPSRLRTPVCLMNLPCKEKDGKEASNAFAYCVKEEHKDAFLGELARFDVI